MESPAHGIWAITDKGRRRLAAEHGLAASPEAAQETFEPTVPISITRSGLGGLTPANLEELADEYFLAFKEKVLQKLQDLSPRQFERFAADLLSAYGFTEVKVTGRPGDDGIDGYGRLKVGLARMDVAFQCKR